MPFGELRDESRSRFIKIQNMHDAGKPYCAFTLCAHDKRKSLEDLVNEGYATASYGKFAIRTFYKPTEDGTEEFQRYKSYARGGLMKIG